MSQTKMGGFETKMGGFADKSGWIHRQKWVDLQTKVGGFVSGSLAMCGFQAP